MSMITCKCPSRRHWLVVALGWLLIMAFCVLVLAFAIATGDIRSPLFPKMLRFFSLCAVFATIDRLLQWRNAGIRWRVFAWVTWTVVLMLLSLRW
jgi:hypothetical protein